MLPYLCKMYVNFVLTKSSFYMIPNCNNNLNTRRTFMQ